MDDFEGRLPKYVRETLRRIERELGCKLDHIRRPGKHFVASFSRDGRTALVTLSATTANQNAVHKQLADVRRQLRDERINERGRANGTCGR